ncbi:MAG: hypothetical protein RR936_03675 [Carnobacterium sp.]|uniref:hypothetical protein n=1 Tax=Carnobacterium sp. TaxID=48221 RepID=UPI002FCB637A
MSKKIFTGLLFVLVVISFFQSNTVFAAGNETQAIFQYVDISTLDAQEKTEIVKKILTLQQAMIAKTFG